MLHLGMQFYCYDISAFFNNMCNKSYKSSFDAAAGVWNGYQLQYPLPMIGMKALCQIAAICDSYCWFISMNISIACATVQPLMAFIMLASAVLAAFVIIYSCLLIWCSSISYRYICLTARTACVSWYQVVKLFWNLQQQNSTSCAGGCHNMPRPCDLDHWTLKVVSELRVTWATSVPFLVFLGLCFLDLRPMYATDRRQTTSSPNAPT